MIYSAKPVLNKRPLVIFLPTFSVRLDVGIESGDIPDESFTASSVKRAYRPYTARFNSNADGWKSSISDFPQWLQVELNQDEMLTHVATQAIKVAGVVVPLKTYKLYYRKYSDVFAVYMENGHPRVSLISNF